MDPTLTLIGALMLVISIVLSPLSSRVGMPVLLIFLVVGMMMGEDGPGGIEFDNFELAFLIANLALGVILLDGGMRTRVETFRVGLRPALVLATLGVGLTAGGAALVAWWVFDLHWLMALLVGAIISSTDAAAVFSLLQGRGLHLNERVSATLEIESGSNDPMAIFLTLLLVTLIGSYEEGALAKGLMMLVQQFGIGTVAGLLGGFAVVQLVNRIRLPPSSASPSCWPTCSGMSTIFASCVTATAAEPLRFNAACARAFAWAAAALPAWAAAAATATPALRCACSTFSSSCCC